MSSRMGSSGKKFLLTSMLVLGSAFASTKSMVLIPGGDYTPPFPASGDSSRASTKIPVPAFRIDAYPVSVEEYLAFLHQHPEWRKSTVKRIFADSSYLISWKEDLKPSSKNFSGPITQISWYAAKAYCEAEGKRLPGTREWERIAQTIPAGRDSVSYAAKVLEWYGRPSSKDSPDDQGSNNAYGVHDLFGKIWEWTSDFNREGPEGMISGERNNSFFCGGASGSAKPSGVDYATYMRFAFRSSLKPEYSTASLGFRCATEASDEK